MQGFQGPRLPDRIGPSEEQLAVATDRVTEVLELELVGVDLLELDPFDPAVATDLDPRDQAMPWVVDEERGVAADRLELVTLRHRGAAVERRDDAARETERAGEHPVGPRRPEPPLAVHSLGPAPNDPPPAPPQPPHPHQPPPIP